MGTLKDTIIARGETAIPEGQTRMVTFTVETRIEGLTVYGELDDIAKKISAAVDGELLTYDVEYEIEEQTAEHMDQEADYWFRKAMGKDD